MAVKRGRPPKQYRMTNGYIDADTLFLYTPQESIPGEQVNRFLQLCDNHLKELDMEEISASDIDEVAQYNRTRMLKDFIIKTLVNPKLPEGADKDAAEQFTDLGFITQIEKLHKQMDKHLENLKARRKDRVTSTSGSKKASLSDMARELDEKPDRLDKLKKENKKKVEEYSQIEDTDPLVFMSQSSYSADE